MPSRTMAIVPATLDEPAGRGIDLATPRECQSGRGRVKRGQNEGQTEREENDRQTKPADHAGQSRRLAACASEQTQTQQQTSESGARRVGWHKL